MSTAAKRSRQQPAGARPASATPASKRLKTTANSHVPAETGLSFLVDEDARAGKKLKAQLTNGVSASRTARVDESHAAVAANEDDEDDDDRAAIISIGSSVSESSEYDSDGEGDGVGEVVQDGAGGQLLTNGNGEEHKAQAGAEDAEMEDSPVNGIEEEDAADDEEQGEPSFGDLLRARHMQPVDVQASLPDPLAEQSALLPAGSRALGAPLAISLITALTQALKTNDRDELERCFQTPDVTTVRATISRLQPQLVATLLTRIAERIHKRPGRITQLMVWVQWSLVTHGGYLAGQSEVMKKLKSLSQVVRERATGLQPLLHVKGKLDLLSSQLEARRALQERTRGLRAEDEDDGAAVTYVEGQDDDWSDDGEKALEDRMDIKMIEPRRSGSKKSRATSKGEVSESEDEDEAGQPTNGVSHDSDNDEEEESEAEDEANGMLDMEAEDTDDDDGEDAEDSNEDEASEADSEPSEVSEDDGDFSDDNAAKPVPLKTLNRKR